MNKFEVRYVKKTPTSVDNTGNVTEAHWVDDEGCDHGANFIGHLDSNLVKTIIKKNLGLT